MWVCLFGDCSGNSQSAESTPVPGHEPSTEGAPMHAGGNRDSSEDIWEWTGGSWGCRFASGKRRVRFGGDSAPTGCPHRQEGARATIKERSVRTVFASRDYNNGLHLWFISQFRYASIYVI